MEDLDNSISVPDIEELKKDIAMLQDDELAKKYGIDLSFLSSVLTKFPLTECFNEATSEQIMKGLSQLMKLQEAIEKESQIEK